MKTYVSYLLLLLFGALSTGISAQQVPVYSFDQLEPVLNKRNDTTYVINFWATWCKPCVKEMPDLMKANQNFKDQKFKMILVSMDFDIHLRTKVIPFINEQNIDTDVILLNDSKQHEWIEKVNNRWSGAIPITILFNKDFYFFREGEITFEELNEIITKNIIQ
ncbi:MAG: TlpA disulfide reductase family protein [Bacteroidales bacterium]|jgi:thiol-disulfide isomerase/thioredoxin|nr:TlpA disulfide reductase family protein [Bacteroidales bacterium]